MRAKKISYFLSVLLLFSALTCSVDALPDTTATFRGGGITIDLTYPEEAHPNATIPHNINITAYTAVILLNFTVVIKAPVQSGWQVVFADKLPANWNLPANTSLEWPIQTSQLPEETNGKLSCFMYVSTNQSTDYATYAFYTTHVSEPTISVLQSLWEDYTSLNATFTALNETYYNLKEDYDNLLEQNATLSEDLKSSVAAYESLLNDYNRRLDEYNVLNSKYQALDSNYRSKLSELGILQTDYGDLNSTHNSLQSNYTTLQADYDELNQKYNNLRDDLNSLEVRYSDSQIAVNNDRIVMFIFVITLVALIAFIIYLKRGKEEPYVVIRKETVSMNQDENSDQSNQT